MNKQKEKIFSIKTLSQICGIKPHTLRAWEKRYGALSPHRTSANQRNYGEKDLHRLQKLVRLVSQGHSISKVAHLSEQELGELLSMNNNMIEDLHSEYALTMKDQFSRDTPFSANPLYEEIVHHVLHYLAQYQLPELIKELSLARIELGRKDFVLKVLAPLFQELGNLVINGKYSITQEHVLSAIVRDQLAHLNTSFHTSFHFNGPLFSSSSSAKNHDLPESLNKRQEIVITTPEGNFHEIAILLASVLCQNYRYYVHYFGPNLPAVSLSETLKALHVTKVILGATSMDSLTLERYLREFDECSELPCTFYIGGIGDFRPVKPFSRLKVEMISSLFALDQLLRKGL